MAEEEFASALAGAIRNRDSFPAMPSDLSLDDGYEIQKQVVEAVADGAIAGWKAGMTAPAGQAAFGLKHPLIGSLYGWGRLENGASIEMVPGIKLECEIGITIDANGNAKSAGPVIEVPRMMWNSPDDAKGSNLTATNIAAYHYIVGEQQPIRDDYEQLSVSLTRDGETVCEASLSDALGGPKQALQWMLSEASVRGMTPTDGMLLITGACGGIHDGEPGSYVADYGPLGTIEFTIK
ncbi:MAG: hypothetical protein OXG15_00860 [Gammaproteobacteria bacterium]|nr:hypothetical protein [Gammaproteobacteria bacterium]